MVLPAAACAGADVEDGPTPLWAYLAEFTARGTAEQDRARAEQADRVAACMHQQGFEWVPIPSDLWESTLVEVPERDEHWVAEHGYGLVDAAASTGGQAPRTPSPNEAIVEALTPAEREAYDAALHGPDGDGTGGCLASAATDAPAWFEDPMYVELLGVASSLQEEAEADPAVVSALGRWRECMADAGHAGYDDPTDALSDMSARVSAAEINGPGTIPADERGPLQAQEIALALADQGCTADSGIEAARRTAQSALETQYVSAHRAELDAWLATVDAP
ncbi:hypothetical protein ACTHAM_000170 [Cellulomonas soli]|uniref:hypothetical protein n=1 Tax=Cellulomonas soli TaxID=931535 RepID=UPI003F85F77D